LGSSFDLQIFQRATFRCFVLTQHLNGNYCVSYRLSDKGYTTGWGCYDTDRKRLM
jgi:hypothetical protein